MGLLDIFRRKALSASPAVVEGFQNRQISAYPPLGGINYNPSVVDAYQRGLNCQYAWIYRTQPAVRAVVDLIATNFAQLPLKLYERVSDTERKRREDHPAAELLADPDGRTPADAFIRRLALDYFINDNAYALKLSGRNGQRVLLRLTPQHVSVYGGRFTPDGYTIWRPDGTGLTVPPENMLHWFGYDPDDPLQGLSKLETLRLELATDSAVQEVLTQLAKSGLRGGYIFRPLEADWSQEDMERFAEQWRAQKQRGDGREPILDEGMEYRQVGITPKDADVIASRQFTKQEVADAYGLPMQALMDGSADARKELYADVLPPYTKSLACQFDVDILRAEFDESDFYFEFDLNEKLRGDFENRSAALVAQAGRAIRTVNEVRALENLPPIEGGDELTIPTNVVLADSDGNMINPNPNTPQLPSPNVMPPQDPNKPPQDGSYREQPKALPGGDNTTDLLLRLFDRQERSFAKRRSFDRKRFTAELTKDLAGLIGVDEADVEDCADGLNEGLEVELTANPAHYKSVFRTARQRAPELAKVISEATAKATGSDKFMQLHQLRALGLPDEALWEMAGFSTKEIDHFRALQHANDLLKQTYAGNGTEPSAH